VVHIENVESKGAFAPFTPSGKLVVNGVLSSSFIAFEESPFVESFGRATISYQWLAHSFEFPHRLVCCYCYLLKMVCQTTETYSADGISHWVEYPFQWCLWLFQQGAQTRRILLACCVLVALFFSFIETLFSSPVLLLLLLLCVIMLIVSSSRRRLIQ
jgi:4-amino-4-deoxy-L-arabinose transferase-like glycosyltransferase